jgi:hypothetical protein
VFHIFPHCAKPRRCSHPFSNGLRALWTAFADTIAGKPPEVVVDRQRKRCGVLPWRLRSPQVRPRARKVYQRGPVVGGNARLQPLPLLLQQPHNDARSVWIGAGWVQESVDGFGIAMRRRTRRGQPNQSCLRIQRTRQKGDYPREQNRMESADEG